MTDTDPTSFTLPRIPPELQIHIIYQLRQDLASLRFLSLVCNSLRLEAQRLLFQSVTVDHKNIDHDRLPKIREFIHHLCDSSASIPYYIHQINLDITEVFHVRFPECNALLMQALCSMRNLRHLKIVAYRYNGRFSLAGLVQNAPFQLRSLNVDIPVEDGFADFVRSQPSLARIQWMSGDDIRPPHTTIFSAQDLTYLKMLHVERDHLAKMFLPQCSISHLSIWSIDGIFELGSLPLVRGLVIEDLIRFPHDLGKLADNVPNLEFLDVAFSKKVRLPNKRQTIKLKLQIA